MNFYGPARTPDGTPLPVGTAVQAVDPDGVVCGAAVVRTEGQYGLLACYGDDPTTPEDEGAQAGDAIRLVVEGETLGSGTWTGHGSRQWAPLGLVELEEHVWLPLVAANGPLSPARLLSQPSATPTATPTATPAPIVMPPTATPAVTPTAVPTAVPVPTPSPVPGTASLAAQVFVDDRCDGSFQAGADVALAGVSVTLSLAGGARETRRTTSFGMVSFAGFDTSGGAAVSIELPEGYRSCSNSPTRIELQPGDFEFGQAAVQFGLEVAGEPGGSITATPTPAGIILPPTVAP